MSAELFPFGRSPSPPPKATESTTAKAKPATKPAGSYIPPHLRAAAAAAAAKESESKSKVNAKKEAELQAVNEEKAKKVRNLTKKLKQVEELRNRVKNGDKLDDSQVITF
jgi:translation initiation factor 2A